MSLKPTRIPYIDAWRLIAVTMVIVSHVLEFSHPWYRAHLPWILMGRAHNFGTFGVKIFFCISGFVICRGLLMEKKTQGVISIKAFYVRRFLRILPPLLLYMLALEALSLLGTVHVNTEQFVYAGLFLCNVDLGKCGWLLAHTWSLGYEEQFYLFFPMMFVVAAAFGGRRTILALTIAVLGATLFAIDARLATLVFALSTFMCMLAGCSAAMYWDDIEPILARMPVPAWLLLTAVTFILGCGINWPEALGQVINVACLPALVCAMLLSTPVKSRPVAAFFLHPQLIYLGKISFTIYLWQQLATSAEAIHSPWINVVALAGTVVVGILSYRYLERPLMRLGAAYSARAMAGKAVPVAVPVLSTATDRL